MNRNMSHEVCSIYTGPVPEPNSRTGMKKAEPSLTPLRLILNPM